MTQPRLLVISALDPSAGAGMLMDLQAGRAAGAQVVAAISAITVQASSGVREVHPVKSEILAAQLETLAEELPLGAVKIGALATEGNVRVVAAFLHRLPKLPVIVDPVIRPTRGVPLLTREAITEMAKSVLPLATLLTPNLMEAEDLTGVKVSDDASVVEAGKKLLGMMGEGDKWVLIKGGHMPGNPVDVLMGRTSVRRYRSSRRPGEFRGTGCALASAIAGGLSIGKSVPDAVKKARRMLIKWMDEAPRIPGVPRCLRP